MIRTIVVDDEPYLRNSIKTSIETTNPNFEVIAEAGNGVQAYNLISTLNPDVVFLDIRMPIMDGLSLLEKLSYLDINPICIILSGYSEFEYAKKALQYQVFDYLLKPIHMEQLELLLNTISKQIMERKQIDEYQYFNYVLKGIKPSKPLNQLKLSLASYKNFYCFYLIAGSYMYIKNNQFNPIGDFWNDYSLSKKIESLYSNEGQVWFISGENQNEILIIVGNHLQASQQIDRLAKKIWDLCTVAPFPITLTYHPDEVSLDTMINTVIDLKYYVLQTIVFGYSSFHKLCVDSLISMNHIAMPSDVTLELHHHIKEKHYNDFKKSVHSLLKEYEKKGYLQYQLRISLIRILEILQDNFLSHEIENYVEEAITNTYSYKDISEILMQYIDDYSKDYYHTISNNLVDNIKDHIDEHYTEQLALKDIAAHFYVSPSYLSTIFKKAYSISPNDYIMDKRIAKAKDLLATFPPISIKQISLMVGYTDAFYFSRLFKTVTGLTPTDYRDTVLNISTP